ncbi:MAG: UDP-2,3-diacylglucosamine diphosphatase, partial [Burkholderiales bacterium]
TDDTDYLAFRAQARSPAWQAAFLARPLAERQQMGRQARQASEAGKRERSDDIMDVNTGAVTRALHEAHCGWLIHGHTHRPADHHDTMDGKTVRRTVLTDWSASQARGGLLRISRSAIETLT